MLFTASYTNLETLTPGIDTNPANINPGGPAPISFTDTPWSGGTTMNIDGAQWAAGLSKRSISDPRLATLLPTISQIAFSYQIRPSQLANSLSQANENDLMVVDPAGIRYNCSMRKNNQTGGTWEIANPNGSWNPTTFKPGKFAPDVWTPVTAVYQFNWKAETFLFVSITDGTTTFHVPAETIPGQSGTGWQSSILDLQSQETLLGAGSFVRDMRNVNLVLQ